MREIQYKAFSFRTHVKNSSKKMPNVCQFELTFGCGLHCRHCYTDCYNEPSYLKQELKTAQIKYILDKVYEAGAIWLCFTGGDPLVRNDFLDIYAYAKNKGFIVTIFTNACLINKEIAAFLKKRPPFVIEMTLNAVTEGLYDKISQVKGSFKKAMEGIDLILKAKLPLKIKTQITKDNQSHVPSIRKFIEGLGISFRPDIDLYARLNGDLAPCWLRLEPGDMQGLADIQYPAHSAGLFRCAIRGRDGIHIDPYGNTFLCSLIRNPSFNLLKVDLKHAKNELLSFLERLESGSNSKCAGCELRQNCRWCPGRAFVEAKDAQAPLEYYCKLANMHKDMENNYDNAGSVKNR